MIKIQWTIQILFLLLIFSQSDVHADENPFNLQKEFKEIDDKEENLFSVMKKELKKDEVTPTIITIGFQKSKEISEKVVQQHKEKPSIIYPSPIRVKREKKTMNKNALKVYMDRVKILNRELKAQKQREKKRNVKRKNIKHTTYKDWVDKNVVPIDLEKEKKLFEHYLDKEYQKAVNEVAK